MPLLPGDEALTIPNHSASGKVLASVVTKTRIRLPPLLLLPLSCIFLSTSPPPSSSFLLPAASSSSSLIPCLSLLFLEFPDSSFDPSNEILCSKKVSPFFLSQSASPSIGSSCVHLQHFLQSFRVIVSQLCLKYN